MPNWCFSDITIYHDDEEKIKALKEKIDEWTSKDFIENGFGHNWLGNIVGFSGIAEWKDDFRTPDGNLLRCRGAITDSFYDARRLNIHTETAWGPMLGMWLLIIGKYCEGAQLVYTAEECGCGLFITNDPDVAGTYYIDIWDPPEEFSDVDSEYEASKETVIEFLQRVLKTKETDLEKLFKMSDDIEEQWFAINKWEFVEAEDVARDE